MHLVLYLLAAITAAAGVMLIGFGIPINEFSLGNTLIIAGTTALTGGVIVLGLAIVNRQLKRLGDLLGTRPVVPARAAETPEPVISPVRPAPAPARPRDPGHADRSFGGSPEADDSFDQPRFRPGSPQEGPLTPPPAPGGFAPQFPQDPPADRRGWRPPGNRPGGAAKEAGAPIPPRAAPSPRTNPEGNFDSIWPNEPRPDLPRSPRTEGAPARPNGGPYPDLSASKPQAEAGPISVLKSGVVDGMAYTLYTDGSIEAELAQGVVRFGSIEELRNHLEKSS